MIVNCFRVLTATFAVVLAMIPGPLVGQEKAGTSSSEAVLAYREAANFQNNGAFEIAVEEWQKFLKDHGKDPLAAKGRHYLGVCQLQLKQYAAAAANFARVLKDNSKFELAEDAQFDLGSCQYALAAAGQTEMYANAAETFADLVKNFPKGKHREEGLFYLGESQYAQNKKEAATKAYQQLIKEFAKPKRRADALYALGVAQEELGKFAEAGQAYDTLLKEFADSAQSGEVRLRKAETVLQLGDVAAAERLFAQLATGKDGDHALARQAYCLVKLDKFAEAGDAYAKLANEFAESSHATDAAISAGRCYYRTANSDATRQWLAKAVAKGDANSTEAAHWLCRLLIKSGEAVEAAELAARHSGSSQGVFAIHLELDRADALYETAEKRPAALDLYAKFVTEHPHHELAPQASYNAAFTALGLKQYDDALQHASTFMREYPQHGLAADVLYVAAECNLQTKDYDKSEKLYRQLTEHHGTHADADAWRVRLGMVAHLQKKHEEAIAVLSPVVSQLKSADARAEAQFLVGSSQFYLNQFDLASRALNASLKANPNWRQADEALLLLARSQAKEGKHDQAKASLQRLLAEHSSSRVLDETHYRLAELHDAAQDYSAAIDEYDVVVNKFGESQYAPYALYGKGWAQHKSKQFSQGIESFSALLERYPQHSVAGDARFARALCRRQTGDAAGAITDIDAYLQSNPTRPQQSDALYERGLAQVSLKDYSGAVSTLEDVLKSDPNYAAADKVRYEIGWALKSVDKPADAAAQFASLAEQHPKSRLAAEAWFHVGENFYDQKQYDRAETAYLNAKSKTADAELAEKAAYKLGWTNFQLHDYADAQTSFQEQLAAYPKGPLAADAAFMKAECLFRQERYQDAWPAYQTAMQAKASTPTIEGLMLLHAGQSAAQLKAWDDSVNVLSQLERKQPESPLLAETSYELGWARQNQGQADAALADYEKAATLSRDHVGARARFMRGELFFAQKKHDEASREFQRAMYGYGGDQARTETKNWQAKSGYEAGRCAEVQLAAADAAAKQKHLADALRCYRFVAEKHPTHELAAEANKRLTALSKLR